MNFLAHFHLAHPTDASRVGALLGDFVKGTPAVLATRMPRELVEGIMLHRVIDQFTDRHPVFLELKSVLAPERRRFAGIILDLFFDHFLSVHWARYSPLPLAAFLAEIHATLERREGWLPGDVAAIVGRLTAENWLGSYGTLEGIALTLSRVSRRRSFLAPLRGGEADLATHYRTFDEAFARFYPELVSFAAAENPGGAFSSR